MAQASEVEKTGRGQYTCPNGPIVPTDDTSLSVGTLGTPETGVSTSAQHRPRNWYDASRDEMRS